MAMSRPRTLENEENRDAMATQLLQGSRSEGIRDSGLGTC